MDIENTVIFVVFMLELLGVGIITIFGLKLIDVFCGYLLNKRGDKNEK